MRASIIVASHQEGERLWRTLASCFESTAGFDCEIIVADDASFDRSVEEAMRRFPQARLFRNDERQGASPAKALGADQARGETLVFLDGHTKPEPGAIQRLVEDIEQLKGEAIVTPAIAALDVPRWKNSASQIGHGYFLELEEFHCGWLPLGELRGVWRGPRKYYESPALIGCALAVGRQLYENLGGFDPHMRYWGVEDLDFGLKSWLMGVPILHDPEAVVGHRFRAAFDNFTVPMERLLANQLRMARKNLTEATWFNWVERCCARHLGRFPDHPEGLWALAWELFQADRPSAEHERTMLLGHRRRDEFWYAERFGLEWPRLHAAADVTNVPTARLAQPSPSPSPPPCPCEIIRDDEAHPNPDRNVLPGDMIYLILTCNSKTLTDITWYVPDDAFKDYEYDNTSSHYYALTDEYLHDDVIQFYFSRPRDNQIVYVLFKADGVPCKASTTFNIKAPIVSLGGFVGDSLSYPVIGHIQQTLANTIQLDREASWPPVYGGFNCKASVAVPAGFNFPEGQWAFWQLALVQRYMQFAQTGNCAAAVSPGLTLQLDKTVPYGTGPWATGNVPQQMDDSPGQGGLDLNSFWKNDEIWETFIMFQPGTPNAKWTPLKKCSWYMKVCAKKVQNQWQLVGPSADFAIPMVNYYTHPEWASNANTTLYEDADCPDFC
jgi:GT2 family glycosyltransferase